MMKPKSVYPAESMTDLIDKEAVSADSSAGKPLIEAIHMESTTHDEAKGWVPAEPMADLINKEAVSADSLAGNSLIALNQSTLLALASAFAPDSTQYSEDSI